MMLRTIVSSKLFWVCALVVSVGLGATWFVYGGDVVAKLESTRDNTLGSLGLGIVPLSLWVAAVVALAVWKRGWLRPVNIWIGSIAYLAAALVVLSYFHPEEGPLTAFAADFDASLGGTVGDALAGESAWLRGLVAFALFAVGTAIAGPRVSLDVLKLLGKASVMVYVAFMMAGGGVLSLFRRMYKSDDKPKADAAADRHSESETLRKALADQQATASPLTYAGHSSVADQAQPGLSTLDPMYAEPDAVSREPALTPMYSTDDELATAAVEEPAVAGVNGADEEHAPAAVQEPAVAQMNAEAEEEHAAVVSHEHHREMDEPREAVTAQQTVTVAEPIESASQDSDGDEPADVAETAIPRPPTAFGWSLPSKLASPRPRRALPRGTTGSGTGPIPLRSRRTATALYRSNRRLPRLWSPSRNRCSPAIRGRGTCPTGAWSGTKTRAAFRTKR